MSDSDWFEVVEGASLVQGDLLRRCPVFVPDAELTWPLPVENRLRLRADLVDVMVLTQSCDLVNNKVTEVLLARVMSWAEAVRDEVRKGNEVVQSAKRLSHKDCGGTFSTCRIAEKPANRHVENVPPQPYGTVTKFRKQLVEGSVPGLSLLHKREHQPLLEWSVVSFHRLYTLPKTLLSAFAAEIHPRLRLRSPYREHLAQAFARYFMRVGLPHDARAFEKEGDVKS